jgi:hypothetical protein
VDSREASIVIGSVASSVLQGILWTSGTILFVGIPIMSLPVIEHVQCGEGQTLREGRGAKDLRAAGKRPGFFDLPEAGRRPDRLGRAQPRPVRALFVTSTKAELDMGEANWRAKWERGRRRRRGSLELVDGRGTAQRRYG